MKSNLLNGTNYKNYEELKNNSFYRILDRKDKSFPNMNRVIVVCSRGEIIVINVVESFNKDIQLFTHIPLEMAKQYIYEGLNDSAIVEFVR